MGIYTIKRIRGHSGEERKRDGHRIGKKVRIVRLELYLSMVLEYVGQEDVLIVSSPVIAYSGDWQTQDDFVVQTENSVFTFQKEGNYSFDN